MKNLWNNIKCFFGIHDWNKSIHNTYILVSDPPIDAKYYCDIEYRCNNCGKTVIKKNQKLYE